jgi:hypothetical protein
LAKLANPNSHTNCCAQVEDGLHTRFQLSDSSAYDPLLRYHKRMHDDVDDNTGAVVRPEKLAEAVCSFRTFRLFASLLTIVR